MTTSAPSSPGTPSSCATSPGTYTSRDLLYRLPQLLHKVQDPARLREWDPLFTGEVVAHLTTLDILRGHHSLDITDAVKEYLFFEHGVLFKDKSRRDTARLLLQLTYQDFRTVPAADDEYRYLEKLLVLARRYVTVLPELQSFIDRLEPLFRRGAELDGWSTAQWQSYYTALAEFEKRREAAREALRLADDIHAATTDYNRCCAAIVQEAAALRASMRSISRKDGLRGVEMCDLDDRFSEIVYWE